MKTRTFSRGQLLSFYTIARKNPSLPPRRKSTTVLRYLRAVRICADWVDDMDDESTANRFWPLVGELKGWAGKVLLDRKARKVQEVPPGFDRWDPTDGVLRHVLLNFAQELVHAQPRGEQLVEFSAAFPFLAFLLLGVKPPERWDAEDLAKALQDMEIEWQSHDIFRMTIRAPKMALERVLKLCGLEPSQVFLRSPTKRIEGKFDAKGDLVLNGLQSPLPVALLASCLPASAEVTTPHCAGTIEEIVRSVNSETDSNTVTGRIGPSYQDVITCLTNLSI